MLSCDNGVELVFFMACDILIVDDEKDIRDLISDVLKDEGYMTRIASDNIEALDEIKKCQPTAVILDIWLGNGVRDGMNILDIIKSNHPYVPVIMISGHETVDAAVSSIKKGAFDFLAKPFQIQKLISTIEAAIRHSRLQQESDEMRLKTGIGQSLIGKTPLMMAVFSKIEELSQSPEHLLIQGQVGCGKRSVAKEIHKKSLQNFGPFVELNCRSTPKSDIEIELFGIDIIGSGPQGGRRIGALEKAHGGTLYISSMDLMPMSSQHKLNYFFKNGIFTRLGSEHPVHVNARIMGATLQPSSICVREKKLLDELCYRLSAHIIDIPSLKERASDIPLLVTHFSKHVCALCGLQPKRFSQEAMALLQIHEWKNNMHELRHLIESVFINHPNQDQIDAVHLPRINPPALLKEDTLPITLSDNPQMIVMPLKEAKRLFEKQYLSIQLTRFGGNISQTAEFVGMERSALYRKLKTLGVLVEI